MTELSIDALQVGDGDFCLSAEYVAETVKEKLSSFFIDDKISILIDDDLSSKAAAGALKIRLRGNTLFSHLELDQLIQHEGFVHMLTAINGRRQKDFSSLGLGSPRTTRSQEGSHAAPAQILALV